MPELEWNCKTCNEPMRAIQTAMSFIIDRCICDDCQEWTQQQIQLLLKIEPFEHTDVAFGSSDGSIVQAHKAVLAGRSDVYQRMFDSGFKESRSYCTIDKTDMTSDELRCYVQFFYTNNISDDDLEHHAYALMNVAEAYNLPILKSLCEDYLGKHISMENFAERLKAADLFKSVLLRDALMSFIMSQTFMMENSLTIITGAFRAMPALKGYESFTKGYPKLMSRLIDLLFQRERSGEVLNSEEAKQLTTLIVSSLGSLPPTRWGIKTRLRFERDEPPLTPSSSD